MKAKIILILLTTLSFSLKVNGQVQQVDCNNLYLDTNTFYISYQQDTIASGNLHYLDTTLAVYPILRLILSDTSIITSPDEMVLTFLDSGAIESFEFRLNFKTTTFPNNTIVNGLFHIYTSGTSGDSNVSCYIPITIILQHPTGINEMDNDKFKVFPNPTTQEITIESDNIVRINGIELTTVDGRQVLFQKNINDQNNIDLTDFSKGIYFLLINTEKGQIRKKIIKN